MRSELRLLIGCVVSVALPASVLHTTTGDDRLAAGLTAPPFAWPRVLIGHLVTALPLGFLIAGWLRTMPAVNEAARGLWTALGCGATGLMVVASSGLGEAVAGGSAEVLLVLRVALATGLVLPWCVLAIDPPPKPVTGSPWLRFAVCSGLAIVPCGLYAEAVVESRTATATELVGTGRLARAERVLIGLVELGGDRPVFGKQPAELRPLVRKELDRLDRLVKSPLPPYATRQSRLARAFALVQLDRLDEAAEILAPLATDTEAVLLLAAVERDRGNWAASDGYYETALETLLPNLLSERGAPEICRLCFDGLAYNARNDRRPADAERALRRGLEVLPTDAPYFHYQLGIHYANAGHPARAIEHLTRAAELDPDRYRVDAEQTIRKLNTATPACVLRSPY